MCVATVVDPTAVGLGRARVWELIFMTPQERAAALVIGGTP